MEFAVGADRVKALNSPPTGQMEGNLENNNKGLSATIQAHSPVLCAVAAAILGTGAMTGFPPAVVAGLALLAVCVAACLSPRKGI